MKKTFLFLFFSTRFFAQSAFAQKTCDTLYTTNGAQTLIEMVHLYKHGVVYTKCGDLKGFRYYTISDEILKIRYQNPEMHAIKSLNQKKISANTNSPKSYKFIFWTGYDLNNSAGYGSYALGLPLQFGLEMRLADDPIHMGLSFQPYYFKGGHRDDGTGIEVGLAVKNFSVGRLSGQISAAYWGLDLRVGQQPYISDDTPAKRIKYGWLKMMPCIGYQFGKGPFALDFKLPIGVEFLSAVGTKSTQSWEDLAIEPTISLGVSF